MFLRALKEKLKNKSGLKYLQEELKNSNAKITRDNKGIRSIACIVDLDTFDNVNLFHDFVDDFSLRPNAVKIIGYKEFFDKNSPYATPVFSNKDLGWNGKVENSYALEFLSREYDLLINYYTDERLMLKLMSVKTKARNLILNTPIKNFKTFKKELKKYLHILNEIE